MRRGTHAFRHNDSSLFFLPGPGADVAVRQLDYILNFFLKMFLKFLNSYFLLSLRAPGGSMKFTRDLWDAMEI